MPSLCQVHILLFFRAQSSYMSCANKWDMWNEQTLGGSLKKGSGSKWI